MMGVIMPIYTIGIIIFFLYTTMKIMFKNKNEEEEEEEDPNASYNKKFYGDANKYDEDYYNNYIKQYQAQTIREGVPGAEVEEVETCMEEVTEDTTSSISVEEELEVEEIEVEGLVESCISCKAEEEVAEEEEVSIPAEPVKVEPAARAPAASKPARMKMRMHPA